MLDQPGPHALDPKIVGPATTLAAKYFPGTPVVPLMSTGATDGIFFEAIGIPVYGAPGIFIEKDMSGIHGLNEGDKVRFEVVDSPKGPRAANVTRA